jgi:transcriptional regulator with XRE-family HTH domain
MLSARKNLAMSPKRMKFSEFLKEFRTLKNLSTAKELYEFLGGEKVLGISIRHFQVIDSGKYQPSVELLMHVFNKVETPDQKALVLSYFLSVLGRNKNSKPLLDFIENNLNPSVQTSKDNIWESGKKMMFYSEEQLDFFINNPDAMRFHKKLLLYDKVELAKTNIPNVKINKMIELDLVIVKNQTAYPSRAIYRIPSHDNSAPRAVAKGTQYIQAHLDLYLSKEGNSNQKLVHALQLVKPSAAKRILEQMEAFKKWIQTTAESTPSDDLVPMAFIGFAKELDKKELGV